MISNNQFKKGINIRHSHEHLVRTRQSGMLRHINVSAVKCRNIEKCRKTQKIVYRLISSFQK